MADKDGASPHMRDLSKSLNGVLLDKHRAILDALTIQSFSEDECKAAAVQMFKRRQGSMLKRASTRRLSVDSNTSSGGGGSGGVGGGGGISLADMIEASLIDGEDNESTFIGCIKERIEMINDLEEKDKRSTALIKIDISGCGNPPYMAGEIDKMYCINCISFSYSSHQMDTFIFISLR